MESRNRHQLYSHATNYTPGPYRHVGGIILAAYAAGKVGDCHKDADAKEIVDRWNAHDRLREAIRVLLVQAEPHALTDNVGAPAMFHAVNIAREALGMEPLEWSRV